MRLCYNNVKTQIPHPIQPSPEEFWTTEMTGWVTPAWQVAPVTSFSSLTDANNEASPLFRIFPLSRSEALAVCLGYTRPWVQSPALQIEIIK